MRSHNRFSFKFIHHRQTAAFTLIELLTVIAIVGVLTAIVTASIGRARRSAMQAKEVSAARQLMVAYHLAATENHGWLMPAKAATGSEHIVGEGGESLSSMINVRWPHRIRPYLGERFKDTLYVNKQAPLYEQIATAGQGDFNKNYTLSLATSFGLNGWFVGQTAYSETLADSTSDAPVAKLQQAPNPSRLIAFTSATNRNYGEDYGYFVIKPPSLWTNATELVDFPASASADAQYGYVAFRHGGKAVVAFLDGHTALMGSREMRDMRLWSAGAQQSGDAGYTPSPRTY